MKKLIINADDFGLTPACDRAIMQAMEDGVITSASCLVWSFPVHDLWMPRKAGIHLRLTDGYSLIDGHDFPRSQQAVAESGITPEFVEMEWDLQIDAFETEFHCGTHLDSHRHTHDLPQTRKAYADLCADYHFAGVPLSGRQRDALRARGVKCADFTEIRWTDGNPETLIRLLTEDFGKYETVHLMCHPGVDDADLRKVSTMTAVRGKELDVLMSHSWKQWLKEQSVWLIGMEDLQEPVDPLACVDILFLSWNRRAFTHEALMALRDNTDWSRVRKVWLYDDGSTDGTLELLIDFAAEMAPLACEIIRTDFKSPVATMNDYLTKRQPSPWFAKIDSDTVVPPGWLSASLDVLRSDPTVDLLGIEAMHPLPNGMEFYRAKECGHIGGIGLMRTACFEELPVAAGRLGFSDWQIKHDVKKAWINPALPVILLDRLPMAPWSTLSAEYEAKGWQRPWAHYTEADADLWEWWQK